MDPIESSSMGACLAWAIWSSHAQVQCTRHSCRDSGCQGLRTECLTWSTSIASPMGACLAWAIWSMVLICTDTMHQRTKGRAWIRSPLLVPAGLDGVSSDLRPSGAQTCGSWQACFPGSAGALGRSQTTGSRLGKAASARARFH